MESYGMERMEGTTRMIKWNGRQGTVVGREV
jgi:hypothetical protein